MNRRKNHWLTPLIVAAATSVVAFAGIGVAAITGHISMSTMDAPLAGVLGKSKGSPASAKSATKPMRVKSTKALAQSENKPINFRRGSRVGGRKSKCDDCGVVDSIRAREIENAGVVASNFWNGPADNGRAYAAQSAGITYAAFTRSSDARVAVNFVVTVRMEDGTVRTIHENQRPPLSIGERVRLVNGSVVPQG